MKKVKTDISGPDQIQLPTLAKCYELMKHYAMLPNIVAHSEQVCRVAAAIMDHLKDDACINREAVIFACLLHDITKTRSFKTKEHHAISGGRLLAQLGFPAIGAIVAEHVMMQDFQFAGELLDKEIVCYADKRVMHDQIVTVQERFSDLLDRYGKTPERISFINANSRQVYQLEEKISHFMKVRLEEAIQEIVPYSPPQQWLQIK
jgi:uncharacterized protein